MKEFITTEKGGIVHKWYQMMMIVIGGTQIRTSKRLYREKDIPLNGASRFATKIQCGTATKIACPRKNFSRSNQTRT